MTTGRTHDIGPFKLLHSETFPAITEDPFHLVDFLLESPQIELARAIVDIGTATGVIPLLLASKGYSGCITGVEVDTETAKCAKENVERNDLNKRIEIVCADYRKLAGVFKPGSFDALVSNPPYIKSGHGRKSTNERRRLARYEELGNLKELINTAKYLLKADGRLFLIFPEARSDELARELKSAGFDIERKETTPGSGAKHFMVEASNSEIKER